MGTTGLHYRTEQKKQLERAPPPTTIVKSCFHVTESVILLHMIIYELQRPFDCRTSIFNS